MRWLLILLILSSCMKQHEPTRLERGVIFIEYHMRESTIRNKTTFLNMKMDHTIETWLSFFFSPYSTGSWLTETNEFNVKPRPSEIYLPDSIVLWDVRKSGEAPIETSPYTITLEPDPTVSELIVKGYERGKLTIDMRIPFPKFE